MFLCRKPRHPPWDGRGLTFCCFCKFLSVHLYPLDAGTLGAEGRRPGPDSWKWIDTEGRSCASPGSGAHDVQLPELLVFDSLTFSLYLPIALPVACFVIARHWTQLTGATPVTGTCVQRYLHPR